MIKHKPSYDGNSSQLVAIYNGEIVGFLDARIESEPAQLCYGDGLKGAVIGELGVHPDFRRQGIASELLNISLKACSSHNVRRIQAWTRDDIGACGWYENSGFRRIYTYHHVWLSGRKARDAFNSPFSDFTLVRAYAEYTGSESEAIAKFADRIIECHCYELCNLA